MNITLTPKFEEFIKSKIEEGSYSTASEVIRDALRLLKRQERREETRLQALRDAVGQGMKGPFDDFDSDSIKSKGRQLLAKALKDVEA